MTDAVLDLDALEALQKEYFDALRASIRPNGFSIRSMNAGSAYAAAVVDAAPALIAAARERDRLREALEAAEGGLNSIIGWLIAVRDVDALDADDINEELAAPIEALSKIRAALGKS